MVALFGLPGSSLFSLVWVPTRSKGEQILDALAKPETQATLNARRESKVISDRAARKLRWTNFQRLTVCVNLRFLRLGAGWARPK